MIDRDYPLGKGENPPYPIPFTDTIRGSGQIPASSEHPVKGVIKLFHGEKLLYTFFTVKTTFNHKINHKIQP